MVQETATVDAGAPDAAITGYTQTSDAQVGDTGSPVVSEITIAPEIPVVEGSVEPHAEVSYARASDSCTVTTAGMPGISNAFSATSGTVTVSATAPPQLTEWAQIQTVVNPDANSVPVAYENVLSHRIVHSIELVGTMKTKDTEIIGVFDHETQINGTVEREDR